MSTGGALALERSAKTVSADMGNIIIAGAHGKASPHASGTRSGATAVRRGRNVKA
jgi:hypothetical protein